MIRLLYFIVLLLFFGCNTENAPDCFTTAGNTTRKELVVGEFSRVLVNLNIELIIKQGEEFEVIVQSGENLVNTIKAEVQGERLVLTNDNGCNVFRKFNQTKVYVTTPKLTEIRTASQFPVHSDGVLSFSNLSLISEDFNEESATTTGNFELQIASENLRIVSNNISSFFIEGTVTNLNVNFASGIGRFEGGTLIAQNVQVFHRGTNKMIVHPIQSLKGELRSTGDLLSKNKPTTIEVQEFYKGRLLFD